MTHLCPSCGYNLSQDETIDLGDWHLDPRGLATWRGKSIGLTSSEALVLHAIAKAGGRPLRAAVIGERVSEAAGIVNVCRVHVNRIKDKCALYGAPVPFETVRGAGYVWTALDRKVA